MFKTQSKDYITRYSFSLDGVSVAKEPLNKARGSQFTINSELLEEDRKVLDGILKDRYPRNWKPAKNYC